MGPNQSRNLWISIGAGIFATFLLYSYSQEKKAELDKQLGEKVRVVVAKQDISEMDTILDNVLEVKEKLKADVEPDAYRDIADLVGTVAAIPIKKGQTLTKNKVLELGPESGLAIQVAPGMRAVTIPVDETRANAKLIKPGDRVDIFAIIDTGKGATQKRQAVLYKQNVNVLSTGVNIANNIPRTVEKDPTGNAYIQKSLTGDTKYNSITLEVDVRDAQNMILLVSTNPGSLYLVLRNPNDRKPLNRMTASDSDTVLQDVGSANTVNPTYNQSSGFPRQNPSNYNGGNFKPGPGQ